MKSKRVRLGVAIAIVGASLALARPAKAEGDDPAPKCDCYSSWAGGHGVWTVLNGYPGEVCVRADCWVPLAN